MAMLNVVQTKAKRYADRIPPSLAPGRGGRCRNGEVLAPRSAHLAWRPTLRHMRLEGGAPPGPSRREGSVED